MRYSRFLIAAAVASFAAACASQATSTTPTAQNGVRGVVQSGTHPIVGASVALYQTGQSGTARAPVAVGHATTDSNGKFFIAFSKTGASSNLYVVATGGNAGSGNNAAIALGGLAGTPGSTIPSITVNERSTVAMAFALA